MQYRIIIYHFCITQSLGPQIRLHCLGRFGFFLENPKFFNGSLEFSEEFIGRSNTWKSTEKSPGGRLRSIHFHPN